MEKFKVFINKFNSNQGVLNQTYVDYVFQINQKQYEHNTTSNLTLVALEERREEEKEMKEDKRRDAPGKGPKERVRQEAAGCRGRPLSGPLPRTPSQRGFPKNAPWERENPNDWSF